MADKGFSSIVVALFAISVGILHLFQSAEPLPYLDEIFHIPQAQKYCSYRFDEWDPMITTLPGLYLFSFALIRVISAVSLTNIDSLCSVWWLRSINVLFMVGNAIILLRILRRVHFYQHTPSSNEESKTPDSTKIKLTALSLCTFPLLYFFTFLFYTDAGSTFFVLLMYYLSLTEQHIPASLAGVVAIIFRQTNVVWLIFVAGTTSVRHLQPLMPKQTSGTLSEILSFLKAFLVNFIVMFKVLFGYGAVAVGFAVFVVINGGVVVGDRSSHTACLNIPQLFYFIAFIAAFSWPLLVDGIPQLLKNARNNMFFCGFILTLFISELAVYKFTYVHKYLLADNRHYPFYVWRKLFARHWSVRYLLVPCYLVIGWLIRYKLSLQQSALWQLVYWICLQRDNSREWQRDQKNYVGQTPHRRQPRCYGGHVMLYDGAPSSNDPPNIQIHGYQASHGHTTQSQRYPHCSGRTGMPSQAATACVLPVDQKDAFMPQYDQYNDQHHGHPLCKKAGIQ